MRLWVSVPVLSVQMKVVDPSVSTASSDRTRTLRLAICSAPHARDSVTVGRRASGTGATVTPIAKTRPLLTVSPTSSAIPKKPTPTPMAIIAIVRTTRPKLRVSGLVGLALSVVSRAIPARRVFAPTAETTASPWPSTTNVPAKTGPASTWVGTLSPVRSDVSTSSANADSIEASAENAIAGLEDEHIAHDHIPGIEVRRVTVTSHGHAEWKQRLQTLRRPVGSLLLDEGEDRVQHDDRADRGSRPRGGRPAKARAAATQSISAKKWIN